MRKAFLGSISIAAIILFIFSSQTGCKKETIIHITHKDTIRECIEPVKDSILVQKTWNVDFVYSSIDGTVAKFTRGGVNTTGINFDNQKYKFNKDGTGTYTNPSGNQYNLNWQFMTPDKRTIQFNVPGLGSYSTWEMVEIYKNYMQFTVVAPVNITNLSTYRLIQAQ